MSSQVFGCRGIKSNRGYQESLSVVYVVKSRNLGCSMQVPACASQNFVERYRSRLTGALLANDIQGSSSWLRRHNALQ